MKKRQTKNVLLRGLAASPGIVEGYIKIVFDPSIINKLPKNTILVVPNTDPSWAALLIQAKGIITNTGNLLCHAAIISRELNIPCIVGTINATELLRDNMKVKMDGSKGVLYNV